MAFCLLSGSVTRFYSVAPPLVLRVLVESLLDTASEDGTLQSEIAAAARYCRAHDHVPDCWLSLEGERYEGRPG